jgi:hypothetical protein
MLFKQINSPIFLIQNDENIDDESQLTHILRIETFKVKETLFVKIVDVSEDDS